MKKSLIALAAVAATGAAMAQSSVTVYGVVDTSVAYVKGQENVSGLLNNGNGTSRLGFRGVEDLGNGLKAQFVLEGAVSPDDGGSAFNFARESTVGLTSDQFGTVRLGRALTASYNAVSRYDMFGTVGLGSTLAWNSYNHVDGTDIIQMAYQNRANNMISYISPKIAGFGVGIDYAFGEKEKNRDSRYVGVGATYDNGPLSLGLGYDKQNNGLGVTSAPAGYENSGDDAKTWQLGGSYDLGIVKLAAFYKQTKFTVADVAGESAKLKSWNLGVSAPVGAAGVVKAAYNNYKWSDSNVKAQQFSLGYVHNLSKRTALYGTYAYLKNKNGGEFQLNGVGASSNTTALGFGKDAIGVNNSGKQQGFQVGVRHAF